MPTVLGKVAPYKRFKVGDLVFHTTDHGKRLKCSSYYAYLYHRKQFVKIKTIEARNAVDFSVKCRFYVSSSLFSRNKITTCANLNVILTRNSHFFRLRKGSIGEVLPSEFTHHAIVIKHSDQMYGVKIVNSYEHE